MKAENRQPYLILVVAKVFAFTHSRGESVKNANRKKSEQTLAKTKKYKQNGKSV